LPEKGNAAFLLVLGKKFWETNKFLNKPTRQKAGSESQLNIFFNLSFFYCKAEKPP